ncbi:bifunctional Xrn1 [Babesia duncani]|uniref:Bifunctional Xrn1 n=1 Tax=Babesia duncani TaxID=323732 RepID=A0AAD9PIV5_9APIC|nr:bifunctional Xrn1 [Babesia duncani]
MGIPTFFKWISSRYPLVVESNFDSSSEREDAFKLLHTLDVNYGSSTCKLVPEGFDNLYLDVNGIVHNCSHSSPELSKRNKSEDDIMVSILQCIMNMLKLVRPKRLLYIAVDGVAPMAKIMQQRERRFRSAAEASKGEAVDAILANDTCELQQQSGEAELDEFLNCNSEQDLEKEDTSAIELGRDELNDKASSEFKFDAIQITPGTPFMDRLDAALRFFCEVILEHFGHLEIVYSGPNVPGEGEHKIAEYIRNDKARRHAQSDFKHVSHLLYGLDADLIILSLVCHEPYICLLRENVQIQNDSSGTSGRLLIDMNNYILFHTGILREYLLFDLIQDKQLRRRPDVMDRIVDDFVLLSLFMGNDFVPRMKFANSADRGMLILLDIYKSYITESYCKNPNCNFWLTHQCGQVNFDNFCTFFAKVAKNETRLIADAISNVGKRGKPSSFIIKDTSQITMIDVENCKIASDNSQLLVCFPGIPATPTQYKNRFYFAKMGISPNVKQREHGIQSVEDVVINYLEGLQWILFYYYRGVPSWSWSIGIKYPPFAVDIVQILGAKRSEYMRKHKTSFNRNCVYTMYEILNMKFELGGPVSTLEQLMLVLPPASSKYLPTCLGNLMTSHDSRLRGYYPTQFQVDDDDALVPWTTVALLRPIPHKILLSAMNEVLVGDRNCTNRLCWNASKLLTIQEKQRNKVGMAVMFYLSHKARLQHVKSPVIGISDLKSRADSRPFKNPTLETGVFPNALGPGGVQIKSNWRFPSLMNVTIVLRHDRNPQFNYMQRCCIGIHQPLTDASVLNLQRAPLAKYIVVGYPYKHVGRLHSIHTPYCTYENGQICPSNVGKLKKILEHLYLKYDQVGISIPKESTNVMATRRNQEMLKHMFKRLPNVPEPSRECVEMARALDLDCTCENVIVSYKMVNARLEEYGTIQHAILPLVTFIESRASSHEQSKSVSFPKSGPLANLNQLLILNQLFSELKLMHGEKSRDLKVPVICTLKGSLYARVGYIDIFEKSINATGTFPLEGTGSMEQDAIANYKRHLKIQKHIHQVEWMSLDKVANSASLSPATCALVFGAIIPTGSKHNVGMNLVLWKDKVPYCVAGLAIYLSNCQIGFSPLVIVLLKRYQEAFPEFFTHLETLANDPDNQNAAANIHICSPVTRIDLKLVYPNENDQQAKIDALVKHCNNQPFKLRRLATGQYFASQEDQYEAICSIWDSQEMANQYFSEIPQGEKSTNGDNVNVFEKNVSHVKVRGLENLHVPSFNAQPPISIAPLALGQTVCYIHHSGLVPIGTRGTIVAIYPDKVALVEVLLEKRCIGAGDLHGKCQNMRGILVKAQDVIAIYQKDECVEDFARLLKLNDAQAVQYCVQ